MKKVHLNYAQVLSAVGSGGSLRIVALSSFHAKLVNLDAFRMSAPVRLSLEKKTHEADHSLESTSSHPQRPKAFLVSFAIPLSSFISINRSTRSKAERS